MNSLPSECFVCVENPPDDECRFKGMSCYACIAPNMIILSRHNLIIIVAAFRVVGDHKHEFSHVPGNRGLEPVYKTTFEGTNGKQISELAKQNLVGQMSYIRVIFMPTSLFRQISRHTCITSLTARLHLRNVQA